MKVLETNSRPQSFSHTLSSTEGNHYKHLLEENNIPAKINQQSRYASATLCCCVLLALGAGVAVCLLVVGNITLSNTSTFIVQWYSKQRQSIRSSLTDENRTNGDVYSIPNTDPNKVVSCYYNFPRVDAQPYMDLLPSNIHPNLCTHINVAFARVVNKVIYLEDHEYKTLRDIVQLRRKNPKLKILLSVGGAGNDSGFSDMVVDHQSRKTFIRSIKSLLRNYTLDGIDLDWEFPALHKLGKGGRERQHFSQLLREIRAEYIREKRDYILTVATAAQETIVSISYDVQQLNQYLDYVNIMTYDFHFFSKYTPFTGLNSPLYAKNDEILYMATLNINYTVHMYLEKGLDANKIVVGIPTYGHTFTLINANNPRVGSPAAGVGSLGSLGFVNYPDVCAYQKNHDDVTVKRDEEAKVPYMYRGKDWVSYDSPESVMEKARYIKDNNLRGAMVYSLNADDFAGACGAARGAPARFPLARSVRDALLDTFH